MDYQELITSYNNKGLDISYLKEILKIAKPLKGRLKYRAIDIISQRSALLNDINNLLITLEKGEKVQFSLFTYSNTYDDRMYCGICSKYYTKNNCSIYFLL